ILHLAEHMLQHYCEKLGKPIKSLSPKAIQAITTYQWPGNVRELEHAIERSVVLADGDEIDNDLLGIDLELVNVSRLRSSSASSGSSNKASIRSIAQDPPEDLSLEDYFQRFVLEHQDTMSETELAQKLGVSRKCLWERRQRFGIPRAKASNDKRVSAQKD
ncbi:MAG: sigma-54-dependent Fis family transcriptional regulator, partial [Aequoribacter sp.]